MSLPSAFWIWNTQTTRLQFSHHLTLSHSLSSSLREWDRVREFNHLLTLSHPLSSSLREWMLFWVPVFLLCDLYPAHRSESCRSNKTSRHPEELRVTSPEPGDRETRFLLCFWRGGVVWTTQNTAGFVLFLTKRACPDLTEHSPQTQSEHSVEEFWRL